MTNRQERRKAKKLAQKGPSNVIDPTIFSLLEHGAAAHNNGNLDLAEKIYNQILTQHPNNADALHLLGLIYGDGPYLSKAIALIRQAIEVSDQPVFHNNIAPLLHDFGKIDEAISEFQIYLDKVPDDTDALNTLGNYYREFEQCELAIEVYQTALRINPDIGGIHNNLGLAHYHLNNYTQALDALEHSLSLDPDDILALNNIALVQVAMGEIDAARDNYKRALQIDPNFVQAEYNYVGLLQDDDLEEAKERLLITLLKNSKMPPRERLKPLQALVAIYGQQKKWVECIDYAQQALELRPTDASLLSTFGSILIKLNKVADAIPFFTEAIRINPNLIEAYIGLSKVYVDEAEFELAIEMAEKALEIQPEAPHALNNKGTALLFLGHYTDAESYLNRSHEIAPGMMDTLFNLSFVQLAKQNLKEGWLNYRKRYHAPMFKDYARNLPQPEWFGSSLKGKRIFLWAEQGLGDEIMFANPIHDILEEGGEVHIECAPRLKAIFQRSFPEATVHEAYYRPVKADKNSFDFQMPFPDLCSIYRNKIEDFPSTPGYLKADPERVADFKARLDAISDRPKIGISWRSIVKSKLRSLFYTSIEELGPILSVGGVDFVNLQYGDCATEIEDAKERFNADLHTFDALDLTNDLDGVAALISSLDLVIAPTNSVAQLSGALGQRTFVFTRNFTWTMLGTDGMPWHPSMRVFKSEHRNAPWAGVFHQTADVIAETFDLEAGRE